MTDARQMTPEELASPLTDEERDRIRQLCERAEREFGRHSLIVVRDGIHTDDMLALLARLDAAERRLAEAERDAARWRFVLPHLTVAGETEDFEARAPAWLSVTFKKEWVSVPFDYALYLKPDAVNEAIDAALAASPGCVR